MEIQMPHRAQTELHREIVSALITSKAINFEAIGSVLGKFGERAARTGDSIGVIINWRSIDICIPPEPYSAGINFDVPSLESRGKG
jgi:hypothetical protein